MHTNTKSLIFIYLFLICSLSLSDAGIRSVPKEATIAFHVSVSQSNLPLLSKFLQAIHHPQNLYLIDYEHTLNVDELSHQFYQRNVHHRSADPYVKDGVSEVINVLDGMAYFLDREQYQQAGTHSFDYFIHTTPNEYPLFEPKHVRELLATVMHESPSPNFFFYIPPHHLSLFRHETDVLVHDVSLSFNRTASISDQLITKRFRHPGITRRALPLPRTTKHFVVNHHFVKQASDSILAKRLLMTLGDTAHVYEHFFGAVALHSDGNIGRIITSTSLRCIPSQALENHEYTVKGLHEQTPTIDFLKKTSQTCLFTGPFTHPDNGARNDIDYKIINQGSTELYQRVQRNLQSHVA